MTLKVLNRNAIRAKDARKRSKSLSPSKLMKPKKAIKKLKKMKKVRITKDPPTVFKMEEDDSKKLKIGILLTYPRLEVKKEEIITHRDKNRPWNKLADPKFVVERKYRRDKRIKSRHPLGKYGIPTDVAVGCFIEHAYEDKDVKVDMILPHEISKERLAKNDLNFLLIYDLLESFHTDRSKDKKIYNTLKECLETADNIFPPHEYQQLIYSKIKYYNYLKSQNISIAPTITMTTEEYKAMGSVAALRKIVDTATTEGWGRFICKPVYGQEAKDAYFFRPTQKKALAKYLDRCMKKYPGIVIQKEIPDFGNAKKSPELRMYYVGNKYQYSVSANENCVVRPKDEGGSFETPLGSLKNRSKKILRKLPTITMRNGKKLPRLLTRIDMGYIVDGKYNPFVNELEFVPSLYSEDCACAYNKGLGEQALIDARLGDQMVKITKLYIK